MNENKYLVLANVTLTDDGGHVYIRPIQTWTTAVNKQSAASITALWLRNKFKDRLVKDEILKVLAIEDWGVRYFVSISESSLNA